MRGMGGHQKHGKAKEVWLTPPDLIKSLGPFDLDPCFGSPRPWDTAAQHYGPDEADGLGGLHLPWNGFVWCNPPYDREAALWLERCALHNNAIALIFARTETQQFHRQVWERASALLFLEGRLSFHNAQGIVAEHNGGAPSVLIAYGDEAVERLERIRSRGAFIDLRGRT